VKIVVVGHVDHGNRTRTGRLRYDSGQMPESRMSDLQRMLDVYRKQFEFAHFVDAFREEVEQERTIDTTQVSFRTERGEYTIVDVPGHIEFIRNMLSGACQADAAILVVSAAEGVDTQTRYHSYLIHLLGIKDVIVAINKMDLVDQMTAVKTLELAQNIPFWSTDWHVIPISAKDGDNVYIPSRRMPWYSGPTVSGMLDAVDPEPKEWGPLRLIVQGKDGIVYYGYVASGAVKAGAKLRFEPSGVRARVRHVVNPRGQSFGAPGEVVNFILNNNRIRRVKRGEVGGYVEFPPGRAKVVIGEVIMLDGSISVGDRLFLKCGTERVGCKVTGISRRFDPKTGERLPPADSLGMDESGLVNFKTRPVSVEPFAVSAETGRFVLEDSDGKHVGAGIVAEAYR